MTETQELYHTDAPYRMTEEELLFAQMRGVMLHIDREMGVWGEDNRLLDGSDALKEFHIHAEQYGYTALQEQFYQLTDGNEAFISYWNSFLPQENDEFFEGYDQEYGEPPDVNDDFPMSLEYDDDDDYGYSPFDHYGEEY